jgi:hypothetical protein
MPCSKSWLTLNCGMALPSETSSYRYEPISNRVGWSIGVELRRQMGLILAL